MKILLIISLVVTIALTIFLFIKKSNKAKYFLIVSLFLLAANFFFRFIPPHIKEEIKARIYSEYLNNENVLSDNSLLHLNDDFNSDSLSTDWIPYNSNMVNITISSGKLILTPNVESVWWLKERGPMIYKMINGDFSLSTKVQTRKASDTTQYPDKEWQFGGVMLRDPTSENPERGENYVFIVIGYRGSLLEVEVKSTLSGNSDVTGISWPNGDAELRISRKGNLFYMMARKNSTQKWQVMKIYERPDLPDELQAAIIVYSFSNYKGIVDFVARFDEIKFWKSTFEF